MVSLIKLLFVNRCTSTTLATLVISFAIGWKSEKKSVISGIIHHPQTFKALESRLTPICIEKDLICHLKIKIREPNPKRPSYDLEP